MLLTQRHHLLRQLLCCWRHLLDSAVTVNPTPKVHARPHSAIAKRMSGPGLTDLPPELLLEIVSYLPASALISLKISSKQLWFTAPSPPTDWLKTATDCQRTAAYRATRERKELLGGRRRCVHCGIVAPTRRFHGAAPLCKWHQARFMSNSIPEHVESSLKIRLLLMTREREDAVWISIRRTYCAHARETLGWHIGSKCDCHCDSCKYSKVGGILFARCLIELALHRRPGLKDRHC